MYTSFSGGVNSESAQHMIRRLQWEDVEEVRQELVQYLGDYYRETKDIAVCRALV